MRALIVVGFCSLLVVWLLTPFCRDFFNFLEIVDRPDARRKLHTRPIPRVGGIPVAISYILVVLAAVLAASFWKEIRAESGPSIGLLARLLPSLVLIFLTGLLDDFFGLTPWQKLGCQMGAALCAVWAGVRLGPVSANPWIDFWMLPLSVLWLVFCANAFNLIDGLDGLASGVGLLAAVSILFAALIHHHPALAMATVPLIGGLLGFLYYNFNPASVFLGDCGSLLIGFLLGCLGLMWHQHAAVGVGKFAPVVAMAVPIAEVTVSVLRRFLRQQPIFDADHNHMHHRLLSLGMTQRKAALILYGFSALGAVLALLETIVRPRAAAILLILFGTFAYLFVSKLGYIEFIAVRRLLLTVRGLLLKGELRRLVRMQICLEEYEQSMAMVTSSEQRWAAVKEACTAAGFSYVHLTLGEKVFEMAREVNADQPRTRLQYRLTDTDLIVFEDHSNTAVWTLWTTPIARGLQQSLGRDNAREVAVAIAH